MYYLHNMLFENIEILKNHLKILVTYPFIINLKFILIITEYVENYKKSYQIFKYFY